MKIYPIIFNRLYFLYFFFILLSPITLQNCTFGSVGNKLEEDQIILDSLLRILRERTGTLLPVVHSYDDQIDDNLNIFSLSSGEGSSLRTYQVQILQQGSFLRIQNFQFRINPSDRPIIGFFKTHTPFTIPLELPPTDPYGKVYSVDGGEVQNFMVGNSEGIGLGSVARAVFSELKVPRGLIASTQISIPRWDLHMQIIQTQPPASFPHNTRNIIISIRDLTIRFLPRCRIEIHPHQTTEWILGIQYNRLLRDTFENNVRQEFINSLFQSSISNPMETIFITDLSSFYGLLEKNLLADDVVFLQESCLL